MADPPRRRATYEDVLNAPADKLAEMIDGELVTSALQDQHWVLIATHETDEIVRVEPFESVALDLKRLWGERR